MCLKLFVFVCISINSIVFDLINYEIYENLEPLERSYSKNQTYMPNMNAFINDTSKEMTQTVLDKCMDERASI